MLFRKANPSAGVGATSWLRWASLLNFSQAFASLPDIATSSYPETQQRDVEVLTRMEHHVTGTCKVPMKLPAAVCQLAEVVHTRAKELICMGAVFTGLQIKEGARFRTIWRRSTAVSLTLNLEAGNLVRVHATPKRYPVCYTTDWPSRVLYMDNDFVVINKPAGLPSVPHVSNGAEDVALCAAKGLGIASLQVCHRLDQPVTGVQVLGRHTAAETAFMQAQKQKLIKKVYKALTTDPVPTGKVTHYMYDGPFFNDNTVLKARFLNPSGPRLLSHHKLHGWKHAMLDVLECKECDPPVDWFQACFPNQSIPPKVYEVTIDLITGRTHQIRAQLAALGAPIIGDTMYGPMKGYCVDQTGRVEDPDTLKLIGSLDAVQTSVGLHAWRMEMGIQGGTFIAPIPWASEEHGARGVGDKNTGSSEVIGKNDRDDKQRHSGASQEPGG